MKRYAAVIVGLFACGLFLSMAAPQNAPPAESVKTAPPKQPPPQPAQSDKQTEQPPVRFTTMAADVIVPVTVTDDKGRYVSNLVKSDFRVYDEGRPQRIEVFNHSEKQPIVVGFLVDLSNTSRIHWASYKDAIQELIWGLLPGDKRYTGYLITYSNEAELVMNTTSDGETMGQKMDKLKPGGGSALYDAIYMACTRRDLVKGEPYEPRRVIVIIGDGHDNASHHSYEEILELTQRNLVTVYGMSTVAFGFTSPDQDSLEKLAAQTGGRVEYPLNTLYKDVSGYISTPRDAGNYVYEPGSGGYASERLKGIVKAVQSIQGDVTTQYVLRFRPDVDPEAKPKLYHKIKVELPQYSNAKLYYRDGYWVATAPAPTTGQ